MTPEERFERIEKNLKEIRAGLSMDRPRYSPEIIRRYREMGKAKGRRIQIQSCCSSWAYLRRRP
jgi:hypothetical protein